MNSLDTKNINFDFLQDIFLEEAWKSVDKIDAFLDSKCLEQCEIMITKEERRRLVKLLKNFMIEIKGFRPIEEAIITSGGVSIKEINPKTMQSKIVSGLYFAGEIIDVDSYTGGFNLQIAYSTGYTAGLLKE